MIWICVICCCCSFFFFSQELLCLGLELWQHGSSGFFLHCIHTALNALPKMARVIFGINGSSLITIPAAAAAAAAMSEE